MYEGMDQSKKRIKTLVKKGYRKYEFVNILQEVHSCKRTEQEIMSNGVKLKWHELRL